MDSGDPGISFGTDGWRATLDEFTTPRVEMVAQAVATYLADAHIDGAVAVGYDAREGSRGFAAAIADVLTANGRDVTLAERDCPTPTLAWTVATGTYAGGLMVTASHNPPEYNGVKFVTGDGAPALPDVTDALEERLAAPDGTAGDGGGTLTETDIRTPYCDHVLDAIDPDLTGLTVGYDAMHGSGRGVVDDLLSRAGATVECRRCDRDPTFGGTAPEPGPERAAGLVERVTGAESDGTPGQDAADLGFVSDGDADRAGIVTPEHGYLDPNLVLALLYQYCLERPALSPGEDTTETGGAGTAAHDVVRTVSTSSLVDRVATAAGHEVHETPVGFKWVARAMGEHPTLVGGEESGGYGVTAHLRNKDGVFVALLLAGAHAERSLDDRIDALFAEHGNIVQDRTSLDCPDAEKADAMAALGAEPPESVAGEAVADVSTVDGAKYVLADGTWLLIRPSGTEPKLRVYAEAESQERVEALLVAGREHVQSVLGL